MRTKVLFVDYVPGLGFGCWGAYVDGHRLGYYRSETDARARIADWLLHGR